VSFGSTVALGGVAGFTIFLGLPVGRMKLLSARGRVALAMFAVGILTFLLVDVLGEAFGSVEGALEDYKDAGGSLGQTILYALLLAFGFTAGSAGIALAERRIRPKVPVAPPIAGGAIASAFTSDAESSFERQAEVARRSALRTGLVIAAAIGLHNFAEGLAIGVSAQAGDVSLATVLIIGFALHNATEGFGIVGPLGPVVPTWKWIGAAGLIAGGPTFIGSIVGFQVSADWLELTFFALAGGAIFYVIGEIVSGMRKVGHRELGLLMVAAGFMAGVITDLVVVYGGG
jgi:ZIP family zinc transporter